MGGSVALKLEDVASALPELAAALSPHTHTHHSHTRGPYPGTARVSDALTRASINLLCFCAQMHIED